MAANISATTTISAGTTYGGPGDGFSIESGATVTVSGTIISGIVMSGAVKIMNGGTAQDLIQSKYVGSGGNTNVYVSDGGYLSGFTYKYGWAYNYDGGTMRNVVIDGGPQLIQKGDLSGLVISAGTVRNRDNGVVSDVIVRGGTLEISGGVVSKLVKSDGSVLVSSGGTLLDATTSKGYINIKSSGYVSGGTVMGSAAGAATGFDLSSGAVAEDLTIATHGKIFVSNGAVLTGGTLYGNYNDLLQVETGGTANNVVQYGADTRIMGGTVNDLTGSARYVYVSGAAAQLNDAKIYSGCKLSIYAGGTASEVKMMQQGAILEVTGNGSANLMWQPISLGTITSDATAIITYGTASSGAFYYEKVNNLSTLVSHGGKTMENLTLNTDAVLYVYDGGSAANVDNVDGNVNMYGGAITGLTQNARWVQVWGGTVGSATLSGGNLVINEGATLDGITVSGGTLTVSAGATLSGFRRIESNGTVTLAENIKAYDFVVGSGNYYFGTETGYLSGGVLSGAAASGTPQVTFNIRNGAQAEDLTLSHGAISAYGDNTVVNSVTLYGVYQDRLIVTDGAVVNNVDQFGADVTVNADNDYVVEGAINITVDNMTLFNGYVAAGRGVFGGAMVSNAGKAATGAVNISLNGASVWGVYARGQRSGDSVGGTATVTVKGANTIANSLNGGGYDWAGEGSSYLVFTDSTAQLQSAVDVQNFANVAFTGNCVVNFDGATAHNENWEFDLTGRTVTADAVMTWTNGDFKSDTVKIDLASANKQESWELINLGGDDVATAFDGATFNVYIDGTAYGTPLAVGDSISGGVFDGYTLIQDTTNDGDGATTRLLLAKA